MQSAEHGLAGLAGSPVIPPALLGKLMQVPTGELVPSGLDMLARIVRPLALFAFDCLEEKIAEEPSSQLLTLMHVCGENEAWQALPGGVDGLLASAFEVVSGAVESRAFELRHLTKGKQQNVVMALPVMEGNRVRAVICLVGDGNKPLPETSVTLMQSVAQVIYFRDLRERSEQEKGSFRRTTAFVELMGRCAAAEDFESAMQTLVNHLRELLGCDRVAVALKHWNGTKLATLSGRHEAKGNSEIMGVVEAGISEAVRRDAVMEFDGSKKEHEMLLSAPIEEMRQVLGPRAYVLEPLRDEAGRVCGGWLFTWKDSVDDFAEKRAFLQAINAQVAVQIQLWQQGKPQGLRGTAKRLWKKATSSQRRFAALITLALLVLAAWPVSYRVKAPCELQAVVRRTVSAPFDATLMRSLVAPGERLKEGQVMAELDGREIQFRLADVLADHARAVKKADAALSAGEVAEQQMAQLEAEAKAQEIKVLEYQQRHLEIRAPIAGLVLRGDLERAEGAALRMGDTLYEVGSLDEMRIDMAVAESDLALVKRGMPVEVRLTSHVGEGVKAEVKKIAPRSELKDGENVFIVEAVVENGDGRLRPGMKGKAKVFADKYPLVWTVTRRAWNYLRMRLW